jgi:hypothetical protein
MEPCVDSMVLIRHGACRLQKFDVVPAPKGGRSRMVNGHEVNEVDREL